MCKKNKEKLEEEMKTSPSINKMQNNIDAFKNKGEKGSEIADKIIQASYNIYLHAINQEEERGRQLDSTININLVILGFIITGIAALFAKDNLNNVAYWLLIAASILFSLNVIVILFEFKYRKRFYLPSGADVANQLFDRYNNNENEYEKDKENIYEGNFISTTDQMHNDMIENNDRKRVCMFISIFLTTATIIVFVISLFFLR